MGTAQEWEKENTKHLKEIKDAMENNDPFLAVEIRNIIAPSPKGENVKEPKSFVDSLMDRILEVIDPVTGLLDNPHGPAVIEGDGTRKWYRRGMLHNPAGPAILQADGTVAYYYLDEFCETAKDLDEIVEGAKKHEQRSVTWRNRKD